MKNIDLLKKIISLCKNKKKINIKSQIKFIKDRPGHDLRYALNSKKIRSKIKWSTKVNISKGLLRTIEWYQNNKKFYKLIKNKNFINRLGQRK